MTRDTVRKETLPSQSLIRFIDDSYCESFVKEGRVRLGNITAYSIISDGVRGDVSESVAMFQNELGGPTSSRVFNEGVFILSCSRATSAEDIKKLFAKFNPNGKKYLEIFNPEVFLAKIQNSIKSISLDLLTIYSDNCYWVDVEYSKGSLLNTTEHVAYCNRHIFQKPKEQLSPQLRSKRNGLIFERHSSILITEDDLFEPYWLPGTSSINYEEEQEYRLVLEGVYSMVTKENGSFKKLNDNSDFTKVQSLPDECKPPHLDLICGDLTDCVRINDISFLG
jgi:hypothetical protein